MTVCGGNSGRSWQNNLDREDPLVVKDFKNVVSYIGWSDGFASRMTTSKEVAESNLQPFRLPGMEGDLLISSTFIPSPYVASTSCGVGRYVVVEYYVRNYLAVMKQLSLL